jgi:hypothetical protein
VGAGVGELLKLGLGVEVGPGEGELLKLGLDVDVGTEEGLSLGIALFGAEIEGSEVLRVLMKPFVSNVTAVMAMTQPFTVEFVPIVTAVPAKMEPSTTLLAPRVAKVPVAQIMFSALAPLIRMK